MLTFSEKVWSSVVEMDESVFLQKTKTSISVSFKKIKYIYMVYVLNKPIMDS